MRPKHTVFVLLTGLFLMLVTTADAQRHRGVQHRSVAGKMWYGPTVGANYSNIMGDGSGDNAWKPGFHAGGLINVGIGTQFLFESGVTFTTMGTHFHISHTKIEGNTNLNYIQLPLLIKWRIGNYRIGGGVYFFAGAYAGWMMSGKTKIDTMTVDLLKKDYLYRADFGFQGGAGHQWRKGFGVALRYQLGILNINSPVVGRPVTPVNQNAVIQFSLYYLIQKM